MKNTIVSIVMAFFMLMAVAHAADVDILDASLNFNAADDGSMLLKNNVNATSAITFVGTDLTLDSDNKINITNQVITLAPFETKNITISVDSITGIDAGTYTGTLSMINQSNSVLLDSVPVQALVPAIKISKIDVTDKNVEKGEKITVTVNYKNIADRTDLQDLKLTVGIYEGDDTKLKTLLTDINGDDLEQDEDLNDLSNGKSSSKSFDFEMPFDIRDGDTFTILAKIEAVSRDSTSRKFTAQDTKEIEASVPNDKIEITKAIALPSTLACDVKRTKISGEIRNIGDNNEDVQVFLRNSATAFEKQLNNGEDISLGDDFTDESDFTASFDQSVDLTDIKSGQNVYTLVAYYNDGKNSVSQDITITAQSCTATVQNDEPVVVVPPTTTTPTAPVTNPTPSSYVTLKDVSGYSIGSDWLIPTIIGIFGGVIGLVIALLFLRK